MTTMQRRLAYAAATTATTGVATAVAYRQVDGQRRPLEGCEAPTFDAALPMLRTSGIGVVGGVFDEGFINRIKGTELYQSMPTSMQRARHRLSRARQEELEIWPTSASGRYHRREESFDDEAMAVFEEMEQAIYPLVEAFFAEDREKGVEGIYRSEMQILNAVPGSLDQAWHSDNQSRGLTIIIPLVDFTTDNGPTQVLVGSHTRTWPLLAQHGAQVVRAPAGAIAAYDSRTYHRGLGNSTDEGRPAIIFCYDRTWSPPPGCGPYSSLANSYVAGILNLLSAGSVMCTSLWPQSR